MKGLNRFFTDAMELGREVVQRLIELPALGVTLVLLAGVTVTFLLLAYVRRGRAVSGSLWRPYLAALAVVGVVAYAFLMDRKVVQLLDEVREVATSVRLAEVRAASIHEATADVVPTTSFFDEEEVVRNLEEHFDEVELTISNLDRAVDLAALTCETDEGPVVGFATIVDLTDPAVSIRITPERGAKILTSDFAKEAGALVAVNGEAGRTPLRSAPLGEWTGNWIVQGKPVLLEDGPARPFLSFDADCHAKYFEADIVDVEVTEEKYDTLWGRFDLLVDGEIVEQDIKRNKILAPRTLMGIDEEGETLYLMVVDGRQPGYSVGLSLMDAALVMHELGAYDGMSCDEGGSTTMYLEPLHGLVNRPSAGYERPVYSHFGIAVSEPPFADGGG